MERLSNGLIPIYINIDLDDLSSGDTNITNLVNEESKKILFECIKKYNNNTKILSKIFKIIFIKDVFKYLVIPSSTEIFDDKIITMTFARNPNLYIISVGADDNDIYSIIIKVKEIQFVS